MIAFDVETTGLTEADRPCGYVVTDHKISLYIPIRHEGGGNIPLGPEFEKTLASAFVERSRRKLLTVGHNIAFDLWMARKEGIIIDGPLEDTMINEGLINDIADSFSLESCCDRAEVTRKLGADLYRVLSERYGGIPDRKQMGSFYKLPGDEPVAVEYATGDGTSTLELWQRQQQTISELGLERVHSMECQLIPYLAAIRARGLKIDAAYAERVNGQLEKRIKDARRSLPEGFAVRSPREIESAYRNLGIDDFRRTAGGAPSFTEAWLQSNELGRAIITVRQLEKARDSFITPLTVTNNRNGRVHPTLNQSKGDDSGAIGGRLSCSGPNLQAYPKRNKEVGSIVRPLVIPDDGMVIYEDDFQQQEPRLFAHYSEDPNLLGGYLMDPPQDIHTTASLLTGRVRDEAKRIGLGILTGLGYDGLALRMGWDFDRAKRAHDQFLKEAFPGVRTFQQDAKGVFYREGMVRTLLGRIAHLDDRRFAYRAVSRIIQGSGADHTKLSLLRACQFADSTDGDIEVLMTIHDSFISQATPGAPMEELKRVLENSAKELELILPIPIERGSGSNWAEASYGSKL